MLEAVQQLDLTSTAARSICAVCGLPIDSHEVADSGYWLCRECAGKTIASLRATLLDSQREAGYLRKQLAIALKVLGDA